MIRMIVLAAMVVVDVGCMGLQPASLEPRSNYASVEFVDLPRAGFPDLDGVGMWR